MHLPYPESYLSSKKRRKATAVTDNQKHSPGLFAHNRANVDDSEQLQIFCPLSANILLQASFNCQDSQQANCNWLIFSDKQTTTVEDVLDLKRFKVNAMTSKHFFIFSIL